MDDRLARKAIMSVSEPGAVHISRSISIHGSVETWNRILAGNFYEQAPQTTANALELDVGEIETEWESSGARFLIPGDADWPISVDALAVPPIGLSVIGSLDLSMLSRSVAIVGSRIPTHYGVRIAQELAAELTSRGYVIVSGGAIGVDAAAHHGALSMARENYGGTCAVLACGVSEVYPKNHASLFREISANGLLISEVRPNAKAFKARFLIRNRIIAALSLGTVVVEAAIRSGSLRTAYDASELHRHVMGIPGQVNSPLSAGVHDLIIKGVATLITNVEDICSLISPLDSLQPALDLGAGWRRYLNGVGS